MTAEGKYCLAQNIISSDAEMEIDESDYEEIRTCVKIINKEREILELFSYVCNTYKEMEIYTFKMSLDALVSGFMYGRDKVPNDMCVFSQLVSNYLSSVRMYLDTLPPFVEFLSSKSLDKESVGKIKSKYYDQSYAYRVMEALRNYTQHRGFIVQKSSTRAKWDDSWEKLAYSVRFTLHADDVKEDEKFKKSVLQEIEKNGGEIDLNVISREYFDCLCKITKDIRGITTKIVDSKILTINDYVSKWESNNTETTGLVACKIKDGIFDKSVPVIDIPISNIDYIVRLRAKFGGAIGIEKKFIDY